MPRRKSTDSPAAETAAAEADPQPEVETDGAPEPAAGDEVETRPESTEALPAPAEPEERIAEPGQPLPPADESSYDPDSTRLPTDDGDAPDGAGTPDELVSLRNEGDNLRALTDLQAVTIDTLARELAEAHARGYRSVEQNDQPPTAPPFIPSGDEPKGVIEVPEPVVEAPPTVTSTEGWAIGQTAPADRWGVTDPDGATTPTAGHGITEPPPGSYAALLVRKGDVVTAAIRAACGYTA